MGEVKPTISGMKPIFSSLIIILLWIWCIYINTNELYPKYCKMHNQFHYKLKNRLPEFQKTWFLSTYIQWGKYELDIIVKKSPQLSR